MVDDSDMIKRKARKVARRHLAALADQLPTHHRTPVHLSLAGMFGFLLGAILGMVAGLAAATPPERTPLAQGSEDLNEYLETLKARAKEFGEQRRKEQGGEGQEAGQPA